MAASGISVSSWKMTAFRTFCSRGDRAYLDNGIRTPAGRHLLKELEEYLRDDTPLRSLLLWLGAGKDAGDGQLQLKRRWFMP